MTNVYGIDPAQKTDYFGIVVHKVENKMAKMVTLRKIRNFSYPDVLKALRQELFTKYPPSKIVIDYSNEKTLSESLERQYGNRVETINFTIANKLMLKQDGLKILQMGYEWPKSKNTQVQEWVTELREQLRHEQMIETASGKTTFDHPEGEHNDLAIAWELSIHGCLPLILGNSGPYVIASRKFGYHGRTDNPQLGTGIPSSVRGLQSKGWTVHMP